MMEELEALKKKAYDLAFSYEQQFGSCSQCVLAALKETIGSDKIPDSVFLAASGFGAGIAGGGYTCGQLGYARILASKLALATGFDVLSFEYRLAPEHPFPAAIEDAVAMWDYLMYMGYGARDVIVAGDSAGGNLALELDLKLKEQGRAQPRGLVLFSPWTDMTASGKSYRTCKALDPMLTMEYIAAVREAYTGPDADWSRPCYSPLFADLRGLPPTLVQVGTNEILKSDSERLVENLQKAGVYAQLEVYPECWHVFQQMPIRRAAVAMESAGRFVQRII